MIKDKLINLYTEFETSDPFVIADLMGIEVRFVPYLNKPLGQMTTILDERIILISDSIEESSQQYFICAHELSHAMYDYDLTSYYASGQRQKGAMERQANMFACNLLMNTYLERHDRFPDSFKHLQYEFGLPDECMEYYF